MLKRSRLELLLVLIPSWFGQWVVGEMVGVGSIFLIFQNACRVHIVFTINQCVTFKQPQCACLPVFCGGVEAVAGLAQAPWGLPQPKPVGT